MANPYKSERSEDPKEAERLRHYKEQQLPECVMTVEDALAVFKAQDKATLEAKRARLESQDPEFFAYIQSKAGTGDSKRGKK